MPRGSFHFLVAMHPPSDPNVPGLSNDLPALETQAQQALQRGALDSARDLFEQVASADASNPQRWITLALVHQQRGDDAAQEAALLRAQALDPYDLMTLLMRGRLYERQDRRHDAVRCYGAAVTVAPSPDRLPRELQMALKHAERWRDAYDRELGAFMDQAMADTLREHAGDDVDRFKLSLDILLGRKKRHDSQAMRYFVPQLAPVEFFDPALFPWMEAVEAATNTIREEFLAVLRAESDFVPYIQYEPGEPVAQWADLNHSPRWSVYHLWKGGQPVPEHLARCPVTARVLEATPRPDQPGRTPVALFSMLKPHTRIPPHVGASNARLICHLPLIVPEGCRYRVGNSHRLWVPGKAWVFDDTIEHEAINDSNQIRVVLIWDTWHPALTPVERRLITAMNGALNQFVGADPDFTA
jgi:aspartate beta-hydroxylase